MRASLIWILLLFGAPLYALDESHYSTDEIELMLAKKSWDEALLHLPDVLEASRDERWELLVEKAAVGYLGDLKNRGTEQSADQAVVDLLRTFPSLSRSNPFYDTSRTMGK